MASAGRKPRHSNTPRKRRLQGYESLFSTYIRPSFGATRVSKITSQQVESALRSWRVGRETENASWKKRPTASARTHRHAFDLLRNVLNVAVRLRLVGQNVTLLVDQDEIPDPQKPESKVLAAGELLRLLAEAKSPSNRSNARNYLTAQAAYYPASPSWHTLEPAGAKPWLSDGATSTSKAAP